MRTGQARIVTIEGGGLNLTVYVDRNKDPGEAYDLTGKTVWLIIGTDAGTLFAIDSNSAEITVNPAERKFVIDLDETSVGDDLYSDLAAGAYCYGISFGVADADRDYRLQGGYHIIPECGEIPPLLLPGQVNEEIELTLNNLIVEITLDGAVINGGTGTIYPQFSESESYAINDQVSYGGGTYTFTSIHPAGAWEPLHVKYSNQEVFNVHAASIIAHGTGSAIVGVDDEQTLTNKTLDDPSNTIHADALHLQVWVLDDVAVGDQVRYAGYDSGTNTIRVRLADNSLYPSIGTVSDAALADNFAIITATGIVEPLDTSIYILDDPNTPILWVNGLGELTGHRPETGFEQPAAFILRDHAIHGSLQILAAYPLQDADDVRFTSQSGMPNTRTRAAIDALNTGKEQTITPKNSAFNKDFSGTGSEETVARSDHGHSHTTLDDIGSNTHPQIDTALTRLAETSGNNTGDQTATTVPTVDAGDYFVGENVEAQLQEMGESRLLSGYDLTNPDSMPDIEHVDTWDDATRTFNVRRKAGQTSYHFWCNSKEITHTTTQSGQLPDVTGGYYFVFNNDGILQVIPKASMTQEVFYQQAITGIVYWNALTQRGRPGYELHGRLMSPIDHRRDHLTVGALWESGGDMVGLADGSDVYASMDGMFFWDEDIRHSVASALTHRWMWRGVDGAWVFTDLGDSNVSHNDGGAWDVWNEETSPGVWALTEGTPTSDFWIIYVMAFPSLPARLAWKVIGQEAFATKQLAWAAIETSLDKMKRDGLSTPEIRPVGAWIVNRSGDLVAMDDGSVFYNLRKITGGGGIASPSTRLHSDNTDLDQSGHPSTVIRAEVNDVGTPADSSTVTGLVDQYAQTSLQPAAGNTVTLAVSGWPAAGIRGEHIFKIQGENPDEIIIPTAWKRLGSWFSTKNFIGVTEIEASSDNGTSIYYSGKNEEDLGEPLFNLETTATTPATVNFTVATDVGSSIFYDFGDGSGVVEVAGTGANVLTSYTYPAPATGDKVRIWFSDYRPVTCLHLSNNQLSGVIPAEIGNLVSLTTLYLYSNQLSGYTSGGAITFNSVINVNLSGCAIDQSGVSDFLIDFDNGTTPKTGSIVNLTGGTNAVPTAAGIIAGDSINTDGGTATWNT